MDCSVKATIIDDFSRASLFTTAKCILVVEKDATFRKLIDEGFLKLFPNALLVTVSFNTTRISLHFIHFIYIFFKGRGYPDIATRIMLEQLSNLPLFGLLDCDPHGMRYRLIHSKLPAIFHDHVQISLVLICFSGIEIAMTYKYGGCSKKFNVENRTLSHFEWIGLSRCKLPK